jgi:eukaryotic-like serine/threonine-protein kinase
MPESSETIAYCQFCANPMNVETMAPFANVECPTCGRSMRVKREFGPYTLVRRHAVGGMSMVFVARDNTLDREVALKILSENFSADETRIAAFEEEARITASLSHPHVVRVMRTGRSFGRFYIAMELVPGGHFEHQIKERGKISELEVLPLAIQVAQGLKSAHSAGLIHRDVKPGNILLDAEGSAKLVDFGLALVTQCGKAQATELWATPYYVPPETIEGYPEDFRSDIYAFGATLYHALAGFPPCCEVSMATEILREAKKKVVALSLANPELSVETCNIVERAMAYDPKDRYSSYDEMIDQLEGSLKRLKSSAVWATETSGNAARRLAKKKRGELFTLGVAASIMLAALSCGIWWITRKAPVKESVRSVPVANVGATSVVIADSGMDIAKGYREARAAVEAGDFATASTGFMALADQEDVQEPTRTWAGVEAVIALYLQGKSTAAKDRATATAAHASEVLESSRISEGLIKVLAQQPQLAGILKPELGSSSDDASQVTGEILAGLKNWEQGQMTEAAVNFTSATTVKVTSDHAWLGIYQNLSQNYLSDFKQLSSKVFETFPDDSAGCQAASAELDKILATLKTRGRAPFNVRTRQISLARHAKSLSVPKAAPSVKVVAAAELASTLAKIDTLTKKESFAEAAAELKKLTVDPPGARRSSLIYMTDNAANFLTDLAADITKNPVTGKFELKSGAVIEKISIGPDGQLLVIEAGGASRRVNWADISADALIRLHRIVVKTPKSESERLRRNECAISYDWLAGNRERALSAATLLSQGSADFKRRWDAISLGLPK